ncbi:MAG: GTPase Era [Synergistaceae bacterium]|nr:GTPase Era [Synergistaceae bacterium]
MSDNGYRSGFTALLGRPNVGKSSIINALLKEKVAAVSPKPQTTRNAVRCIYTSEREQIIFVDTPGIHTPKHALGEFMMKEAEESLSQVDAVCYVVEARDREVSEKDRLILDVLAQSPLPVILAVNKTDKLESAEDYKKAASVYEEYIKAAAVVPLSANNGVGLAELAAAISAQLPAQTAIYPEDMLMDSTERFLASEVIREKILRNTDEEVPHSVAVLIDEFKSPDEFPDKKICDIRATIIVDRPGQKGIIIGKKGEKLKRIGSEARKELEEKFGYKVFLQLWVKVKPGWRKSQEELRRLGYGV